ncbi:NUMOD3 domain-containing DNA-binding protein [Streptomyces sp. ME08-AFT2]|uniref:NUMOD3 domain-containing DNA-binding protein n=1 Tax=Streptomyces sp. ME08-AFT2 TaxID=3028683 RepID=UPI0029AAF15F|nr:NUMOD3 domain-containing DNA-binding protein [Streptomyces sp. ME08-AFT2]MDX3311596.1 NUMOD3 domain-containing DNA-binding protein [Streptomyces sp. ME08-AFT2]
MKTTTTCPQCGVEFTRYHTAKLIPKFCSRKCANHDRVGKASAETRAKLSAANSGKNNNNWGGGTRTRAHDGRVFFRVPRQERHLHPTVYKDGYILRYVYVWNRVHPEDPVRRGDVIHHINENPSDDRIENLEKTTQPRHASHHSTGRQMPEETRAKISNAHKERIARDGYHWTGKSHTEEARENMRRAQQARRTRERQQKS